MCPHATSPLKVVSAFGVVAFIVSLCFSRINTGAEAWMWCGSCFASLFVALSAFIFQPVGPMWSAAEPALRSGDGVAVSKTEDG